MIDDFWVYGFELGFLDEDHTWVVAGYEFTERAEFDFGTHASNIPRYQNHWANGVDEGSWFIIFHLPPSLTVGWIEFLQL